MIWIGEYNVVDVRKDRKKIIFRVYGSEQHVKRCIEYANAYFSDSHGTERLLSYSGYCHSLTEIVSSNIILCFELLWEWIQIHIFKKRRECLENEELFFEKFINKIRDKKADRRIKKYAKKGETMDVHDALRLLTKAYMKECGGSLGYRTLIYTAAEMWQVELKAGCGNNFTEEQVDGPLVQLMPFICEEYDPEHYDKWDIAGGISLKDFKEMCSNVVKGKRYDADTLNALCWGMKKYAEYIAEWES